MRTRWVAAIPSAERTRTVTTTLSLRFGACRSAPRAARRSAFVLPSRNRTVRFAARFAVAPLNRQVRPPTFIVALADAVQATGPQPATTLRSSLFVSSWARLCLTVSARRLAAGVAGAGPPLPPDGGGAPPPGCGVGSGSVAGGAGVTSNDTDARSSAGIGSATAESTATSTVRDVRAATSETTTGTASVVASAGISCGRSQTRSRPATAHVQPC